MRKRRRPTGPQGLAAYVDRYGPRDPSLPFADIAEILSMPVDTWPFINEQQIASTEIQQVDEQATTRKEIQVAETPDTGFQPPQPASDLETENGSNVAVDDSGAFTMQDMDICPCLELMDAGKPHGGPGYESNTDVEEKEINQAILNSLVSTLSSSRSCRAILIIFSSKLHFRMTKSRVGLCLLWVLSRGVQAVLHAPQLGRLCRYVNPIIEPV